MAVIRRFAVRRRPRGQMQQWPICSHPAALREQPGIRPLPTPTRHHPTHTGDSRPSRYYVATIPPHPHGTNCDLVGTHRTRGGDTLAARVNRCGRFDDAVAGAGVAQRRHRGDSLRRWGRFPAGLRDVGGWASGWARTTRREDEVR